jgi:hypothetical protein
MIAATPSVNGGYTVTAPTTFAALIAGVVPMVPGGETALSDIARLTGTLKIRAA